MTDYCRHQRTILLVTILMLTRYCQENDASAVQIACDDGHTCAVLNDTTVKCWGRGTRGQLGYGDTNDRGNAPDQMGVKLPRVQLGTGRTAKQLSLGVSHTCVLLDDATVKCWGFSANGQLGLGDDRTRGDNPGEMGDNLTIVDFGTGRTVKQVASGFAHNCALLDDDTVQCWGNGADGQLGNGFDFNLGDIPSHVGNLPTVSLGTGRTVKKIAAGDHRSCAILDDDTLKCWGGGGAGALGQGDTRTRGDDIDEMGNLLLSVNLGTNRFAKDIAMGNGRTCAFLDDDTLKCFGYGEFGVLGYGDGENRGDQSDEMGDDLPAINLGVNRKATKVAIGVIHTCAILDDGTVKCWGVGSSGSLGYGELSLVGNEPFDMGDNLTTVLLGAERKAKDICAGFHHTCVILDDDTVKCWGSSSHGQLGYGDPNTRGNQANQMGDNLPTVDLGLLSSSDPGPSGQPDNNPFTNPAVLGGIGAGAFVLVAAVAYFVASSQSAAGCFGRKPEEKDMTAKLPVEL